MPASGRSQLLQGNERRSRLYSAAKHPSGGVSSPPSGLGPALEARFRNLIDKAQWASAKAPSKEPSKVECNQVKESCYLVKANTDKGKKTETPGVDCTKVKESCCVVKESCCVVKANTDKGKKTDLSVSWADHVGAPLVNLHLVMGGLLLCSSVLRGLLCYVGVKGIVQESLVRASPRRHLLVPGLLIEGPIKRRF